MIVWTWLAEREPPKVSSCMAKVIKGLTFTKPTSGTAQVALAITMSS